MISRKQDPPAGSFFLFGPRGTGKTTWLKQAFPQALYLDLLDPKRLRELSTHPEKLIELTDALPQGQTVVIDEIQRVPELLTAVHKQIESKGVRFVLTGSSSRKLKRSGVDLLGGRAVRFEMHPFTALELGKDFSLNKALAGGMLPLVWNSPNPEAVLSAYVSLYLREEVQAEGLVRNIGAFSRFLEAASFSHAQVLNLSNLSRECSVERKTVEGHIGILEDLMLASRLQVFTRRAQRALIQHPKLYFFDAGVFRALRPSGPLDRKEEIEGAALEGLVHQNLKAYCVRRSSLGKPAELFYWRTKTGAETDFVMYGNNLFKSVEVKNSAAVQRSDLKGLKTFALEYPQAQLELYYRGKDRLKIDGVMCIPAEEALRELGAELA